MQDKKFLQKMSPQINWKIFEIPPIDECPECAKQRRLIRRNERKLYKRTCDLSWDTFISNLSPEKPLKVYKQEMRLSDQWDAMGYGFDFDFSKSFFQQLSDLIIAVPAWLLNFNSENSDYVWYGTNNKNVYLCYCASYNQNCYYSRFVQKCEDCIDCLFISESRKCYECVDVNNGFDLFHCQKCNDCSRSRLLINCNSCNDCFWCRNINNKQYCIYNKQYSKEEYTRFMKSLTQEKYLQYKAQVQEKAKHRIVRSLDMVNCENSTGDHLNDCKNCENCFDGLWAQECKDCNDFGYGEYMYNLSYAGYEVKYAYEMLAIEQAYKSAFCISCIDIKYCYYDYMCTNCEHCFACVGLTHKQYCIFNKQYTKEEYEKTLEKIIIHMQSIWERWQFIPKEYCFFGYNETLANEYYPLTREQALNQWFKRQDVEYPIDVPSWLKIIQAKEIEKYSDENLLKVAIRCSESGKPFRLIKQEIDFYRKNNLPLPTLHPDIRHQRRATKRNPQLLRERECAKCHKEIKTSYAPERPEIVYCGTCYDKNIYS